MTYELVDVDQRHQESPDSFWVPPLKGRRRVPVGLFVKLIFELPDDRGARVPPDLHGQECGHEECTHTVRADDRVVGERMWVKVLMKEEVGGRIRFRGVLDSVPTILRNSLTHGDVVEFGPQNIIDAADPDKVTER